jgi:signal transduction histidine kinase
MAETLSESNLSNRINIAGTKNELKDLATVINRMLDRIERSYNSQKQFVSDASHELRTPISVIRGYTDMLKRWGKDDPEILDEGITAISQETESMKDLVESLLFLARHDKKTLMMEMSSFDPAELIREIQKEETMVHTEYHFKTARMDPLTISADRNMMKQVLRILCDNAVKYSSPGTTVTLSCTNEPGGNCCLSVKDEGQGISQEELPKIFERFYRSDKARQSETGGHGLGLSIARIIVVAHKGKLRVRSKPGCGSIFSIILPNGTEKE